MDMRIYITLLVDINSQTNQGTIFKLGEYFGIISKRTLKTRKYSLNSIKIIKTKKLTVNQFMECAPF